MTPSIPSPGWPRHSCPPLVITLARLVFVSSISSLPSSPRRGGPTSPAEGPGGDLSFAQARKLVKLLPSVLRTFLRPEVIKRGYLAKLQHCVFSAGKGKPPKREDDWPSAQPEVGNVTEAAALEAILQAYLSFGASLSAVFQKTAHPGLRSTIVKGRKAY